MSMELCGPNMSESGGSMCQVKQLPCHSISLCRLQAGGHHMHNLPHLTHQPWANHQPPAMVSSPAVAIRHRINGATAASCSSLECAASRLEEVAALDRGISMGKVLVTGGGGYFGFRLGRELARQGMSVVLLDMNKPPCEVPDGAIFYQSDIRDYPSLYKVCEGIDCIFHTASYGMSGPEQLRKEQVESINIGGTNNVINVCKERSIPRLVYTSTINVVFAGKPIEDGDEDSVPYVPPEEHIDHYSRTKAIAEQMVLSANGCSSKGGELLRTCVLRPCGIYGPEERRHLHRVMVNVERRLFSFRFGDPRAKMNWVHVDNLVLAHSLAAEALTLKRRCVASGQAYFINDGVSVNLFEWLTPLFEKLGYSRPLINLPVSLVYSAAILVEYLHVILRPVITVPLLFTRNENRKFKMKFTGSDFSVMAVAMVHGVVRPLSWAQMIMSNLKLNLCKVRNIAVSHTFKIDKAHRELDYCPKPYSLVDSVEQYLNSQPVCATSPFFSLSWTFQPLILLLLMGLCLVLLMFTHILC